MMKYDIELSRHLIKHDDFCMLQHAVLPPLVRGRVQLQEFRRDLSIRDSDGAPQNLGEELASRPLGEIDNAPTFRSVGWAKWREPIVAGRSDEADHRHRWAVTEPRQRLERLVTIRCV